MKAVLLIALIASGGFLAADPSRHEKYVAHENDKYLSLFEDYPLLPVDNSLIYPHRAIGRLKVYFHEDGNYMSAPCTAFLVAKDIIASNAHCKYVREHVTADKFEFLLDPAVASAYGIRRTIAVDEHPIAISYYGFTPLSSYDWMFLRLEDSEIGSRVGYFGVQAGIGNRLGYLDRFSRKLGFHTGFRGVNPPRMSKEESVRCEAGLATDFIDESFVSDPLNYAIAQFNDDNVIDPSIMATCLSGYPKYNPQTKERETYESARIHTSNCGIGAIYDNYMKTSCSWTAGNSGSPVYYADPRTETGIAIGIARGSHPGPDDPEEMAKQRFSLITHYNLASFLGVTKIPDYFDPRNGNQDVQVSKLSPKSEKGTD